MVKISSNNLPVTRMNNVPEEKKQNNKYKILNPQALDKSLYNCFDKICDGDGPYCDCDCDFGCGSGDT